METAKISENLVFVRTYFVPIGTRFRYNKRWWRKRDNTKAIAVSSSVTFTDVPYGTIVAIYKRDLPKNEHRFILKEL